MYINNVSNEIATYINPLILLFENTFAPLLMNLLNRLSPPIDLHNLGLLQDHLLDFYILH
jgi:hypothetical protein